MLILRDEMLLLLLAERKRETCEHVRYLLCFRLVVEEKEKKTSSSPCGQESEGGADRMSELHVRACAGVRNVSLKCVV